MDTPNTSPEEPGNLDDTAKEHLSPSAEREPPASRLRRVLFFYGKKLRAELELEKQKEREAKSNNSEAA